MEQPVRLRTAVGDACDVEPIHDSHGRRQCDSSDIALGRDALGRCTFSRRDGSAPERSRPPLLSPCRRVRLHLGGGPGQRQCGTRAAVYRHLALAQRRLRRSRTSGAARLSAVGRHGQRQRRDPRAAGPSHGPRRWIHSRSGGRQLSDTHRAGQGRPGLRPVLDAVDGAIRPGSPRSTDMPLSSRPAAVQACSPRSSATSSSSSRRR